MMASETNFSISYFGKRADRSELNFYDAAQAMIGFQRSLALTAHLVLNGEIITQAPSLKGANLIVKPPEDGSWKLSAAVIVAGGIHTLGTAPKDTPIGHLIASAYDYAVHRMVGVRVDYDKSLGELYESASIAKLSVSKPSESKFESLIEKLEPAVRQIHRPIVNSESAEGATITSYDRVGQVFADIELDKRTYESINDVNEGANVIFEGYVSSYNINTFRGRIFIPELSRTIPFSLDRHASNFSNVKSIMKSLSANALDQIRDEKLIKVEAITFISTLGIIRSLFIIRII